MANALVVGDILEVTLPAGVAYVSYAGKNESLGDAIWVVPRVLPAPTTDWKAVFAGEGYFAFYPANAAVRRRLVRKVGHSIDAMHLVPAKRRNVANVDATGTVTSWVITEGTTRVPRSDAELDESERQLPVADIWNHQYLIEAIASGMRL